MFGRVGWRGKIYSQGMVNKYCSPQQKGHTALHLGGWCVCVQARACVPKWVFKFCCSYSMTFPHRHRQCAELPFFIYSMGGAERGKRNGQIERANVASLFTRASLALSHPASFDLPSEGKEDRPGPQGQRRDEQGAIEKRGEVIMLRQGSNIY